MTDLDARLAYVDARLAYEIDAVAAHDAVAAGEVLLVDTRRLESWQHGHIAGAVHLPQSEIASGIESLPRDRTLVVYGWGPDATGPRPPRACCSPPASTCARCSAGSSTGSATGSRSKGRFPVRPPTLS